MGPISVRGQKYPQQHASEINLNTLLWSKGPVGPCRCLYWAKGPTQGKNPSSVAGRKSPSSATGKALIGTV